MADIELVIKMSEEDYEKVIKYDDLSSHIYKAIQNGTPLPKGHGRIIDESQVTGTFTFDNGYIECYATTIVEADKEDNNKEDERV